MKDPSEEFQEAYDDEYKKSYDQSRRIMGKYGKYLGGTMVIGLLIWRIPPIIAAAITTGVLVVCSMIKTLYKSFKE